MPRGKPHSAALRAKVVAELVTGNPPSEVAQRYSIPERTVYEWLDDAKKSQFVRTTGVVERRAEDVLTLVERFVEQSIVTLTAQAVVAARTDWIEKQSAAGLAQYRGVELDRLIRLLAAFRPADDALPSSRDPVVP